MELRSLKWTTAARPAVFVNLSSFIVPAIVVFLRSGKVWLEFALGFVGVSILGLGGGGPGVSAWVENLGAGVGKVGLGDATVASSIPSTHSRRYGWTLLCRSALTAFLLGRG